MLSSLGLLNSKYDNVLILDADLSTDINELKDDWLKLENSLLIGVQEFLEKK